MGPPPEGGPLPPEGGRGWEIKPICHIFSCTFNLCVIAWVCCIVSHIVFRLIMLDSFCIAMY